MHVCLITFARLLRNDNTAQAILTFYIQNNEVSFRIEVDTVSCFVEPLFKFPIGGHPLGSSVFRHCPGKVVCLQIVAVPLSATHCTE